MVSPELSALLSSRRTFSMVVIDREDGLDHTGEPCREELQAATLLVCRRAQVGQLEAH